MSEEWQFDIVNNPTAITRVEYERNWKMYQGETDEGNDRTHAESPSNSYYEERSPAEIAALREAHARNQIRELVNEIRSATIWALVVDHGMEMAAAHAEAVRGEAILLAKLKNTPPDSQQAAVVAWIQDNPPSSDPVRYINQGNAWYQKLYRAAEKAAAKRKKAREKAAKQSAARSNPPLSKPHQAGNQKSGVGAENFLSTTLMVIAIGVAFFGTVAWLIKIYFF